MLSPFGALMNPPAACCAANEHGVVASLLADRSLRAHFQPIVRLADGVVFAHEALVRGPVGTPLQQADALFKAAAEEGQTLRLENACVAVALKCWSAHAVGGKLFVNVSADAMVSCLQHTALQERLAAMQVLGVPAAALVLEITEHERVSDVGRLVGAVNDLRSHGIQIALDDFGDGRSSLRLWSELHPDYVKIDKYFSNGLSHRAEKVQTMQALARIAETFGTQLVAEGLETVDDARVARDLGIHLGQGYFFGRPAAEPVAVVAEEAQRDFGRASVAVLPHRPRSVRSDFTVERITLRQPALDVSATHLDVERCFRADPTLQNLAIVEEERPVGLIHRSNFMDQYGKPFFRELYGRKSCIVVANTAPLVLDKHTGIAQLTDVLTSEDQRYLRDGFIVTEQGRYIGVGTGDMLVRSVTEIRVEAARHANPLTFLPGNIPITEHVDRLLAHGVEFVAAYVDLNNFKPFNDQYGYWRGDEVIQLAARAVVAHCDPRRDFVGHVGGDDFVVLFQSEDWLHRCEGIVAQFNDTVQTLYDEADLRAGGFEAEDRHGELRFFPLTTMSIGVKRVRRGQFTRAEQVASAAAEAKRAAKRDGVGVLIQ